MWLAYAGACSVVNIGCVNIEAVDDLYSQNTVLCAGVGSKALFFRA